MYALNYTDNMIIKIRSDYQKEVYRGYDTANTIKEARIKIAEYWMSAKLEAEHNIKMAKHIKAS